MKNVDELKEARKIARKTIAGLNYYKHVILSTFEVDKKFKGVSYMLFDKNFNPYLVMPEKDFHTKKNRHEKYIYFDVYSRSREKDGLGRSFDSLNLVGHINVGREGRFFKTSLKEKIKKDLAKVYRNGGIPSYYTKEQMIEELRQKEVSKRQKARAYRVDSLDLLEIVKKKYVGRGLGKEMYHLFEYNSFVNGAVKMKGRATPINSHFIERKELFKFYEDRGIKVNQTSGMMTKNINSKDMAEYAKRISTFVKDGAIIKVIFPPGKKEIVLSLINQNKDMNKLKRNTIKKGVLQELS